MSRLKATMLSNSAAEFLDNHEEALGAEVAVVAGSHAPQFVPEMDKFVPSPDSSEFDHFEESEKRKVQFSYTLKAFCRTLKERKLDHKLGIEIKDPSCYTVHDVLELAHQLNAQRRDTTQGGGALKAIRKCFRRLVENRGTLHNLLCFLPTDTYGSPICGGFTMILAALDRAENLREEILQALGDIPRQLERTHMIINVHKQSKKLKNLADAVFVAIFEVLESIIKELSKSLKRKSVTITLKGQDYGTEITASIENLQKASEAFSEEARDCDSRRLGRTEEHAAATRLTVDEIRTTVDELLKAQKDDREAQSRNEERQVRRQEEFTTAVYNSVYALLTSSEFFNDRTGILNHERVRELQLPWPSRGREPAAAVSSRTMSNEDRQSTSRQWLRKGRFPKAQYSHDTDECLAKAPTMELGEKDKIQWVIQSDELKSWFTSVKSSILAIDVETPSEELVNPVTVASAFVHESIAKGTPFPVLAHFSFFRTLENAEADASGPLAMMQSLTAQLLNHIVANQPGTDLGFLTKKRFRPGSLSTVAKLGRAFEYLVEELDGPGGGSLFVIVDAVSRLSGPLENGVDAILELIEVAKHASPVVKLLLTDPGPLLLRELKDRDVPVLYVPDHVDGGRYGLNMEVLEEETSFCIEEFKSSQTQDKGKGKGKSDDFLVGNDSSMSSDSDCS